MTVLAEPCQKTSSTFSPVRKAAASSWETESRWIGRSSVKYSQLVPLPRLTSVRSITPSKVLRQSRSSAAGVASVQSTAARHARCSDAASATYDAATAEAVSSTTPTIQVMTGRRPADRGVMTGASPSDAGLP